MKQKRKFEECETGEYKFKANIMHGSLKKSPSDANFALQVSDIKTWNSKKNIIIKKYI